MSMVNYNNANKNISQYSNVTNMSSNKRQKTDSNYESQEINYHKSSDGSSNGTSSKLQPSFVVHARNLAESVTENDIINSLERYGIINLIVMMPKKRQALIEFSEITSAISCVNDASRTVTLIAGQPAYLNYSNTQKIARTGEEDTSENNVLLFTIQNPLYPITVDVMNTICSSFGRILRIIIFRKTGVQSMVEFDSIDSARKAKEALDGADIYSGCCTLKIEYAKPTRLNVPRNDQDNWDYTSDANSFNSQNQDDNQRNGNNNYYNNKNNNNNYNNNSNTNPNNNNNAKPQFNRYNSSGTSNNGNVNNSLSNNTGSNSYNQGFNRTSSNSNGNFNNSNNNNGSNTYNNNRTNNNSNTNKYMPNGNTKEIPSLMNSDSVIAPSTSLMNAPPSTNNNGQILIMCGNICFEKMNCDKMFNLFCLYGNVDRIKFLMTKEGSVMLQMNNSGPIYNVLNHLNNTYLYGRKMQIQITKQSVLNPVNRPGELKDGTPSYKDYTTSRNNRFQTPDAAQKNKPVAPANVLHWFNAPPGMDEQKIVDIFVGSGAKTPNKVKIFPKKSEKCSTGLVEWNNIADCVEALLVANHHEINHPSSKFPYTFKLCFSATPIVDV